MAPDAMSGAFFLANEIIKGNNGDSGTNNFNTMVSHFLSPVS